MPPQGFASRTTHGDCDRRCWNTSCYADWIGVGHAWCEVPVGAGVAEAGEWYRVESGLYSCEHSVGAAYRCSAHADAALLVQDHSLGDVAMPHESRRRQSDRTRAENDRAATESPTSRAANAGELDDAALERVAGGVDGHKPRPGADTSIA